MKTQRVINTGTVLATAEIDGAERFLLTRNNTWDSFAFPASKTQQGERPEAAAARVASSPQELGLRTQGKMKHLGTARFTYQSKSCGKLTDYSHHVYQIRLPEIDAVERGRTDGEIWLSPAQLSYHDPIPGNVSLSPTVSAIWFDLQSKRASSQRAASAASVPRSRLAAPICDALVEVVQSGLRVLRAQTDVTRAVIVGKSDTLSFDLQTQYALFNASQTAMHKLADSHGVSFRLRVLGEESSIESTIGSSSSRSLDVTVDPCDGSTNYKGYLSAPRAYRDSLPLPDTGISIAAQLDPDDDARYIAGVATDVQTGTIYSAYRLDDERIVCRINDRQVDPSLFGSPDVGKPKLNVPFYSHNNLEFQHELLRQLRETTGTSAIYPGRCRASIVDLIRMLAGDCDAMVDVRALDPASGAALKPWDVCGMVPFLVGLGWEVCDEEGRAIAWTDYRQPICFIVSRSMQLRDQILDAVKRVRNSGVLTTA